MWESKLLVKISDKVGLNMKELTIFECPGWDIRNSVVFANEDYWYQVGLLADSRLDVQES